MEKVAIYGGAFNPPTLGHRKVVTELLDKRVISKIILCPDGRRDDKDFGIDEISRKEMIFLFYGELVKAGYNVKLCMHFFADTSGKYTTTYDVNAYFEETLGYMPYHIFGTDVISGIHLWSGNPEHFIEKKLSKIFVSRAGHDFPKTTTLENFENVFIDSIDTSSTQVRNLVKSGGDYGKFLSKNIADFIRKNGLYK